MNIISVIPLDKAKIASELTYFTSSDVPVGAIVSVPLRSKKIQAIVTDSKPAADYKSEIKTATFEIRKLDEVKATLFFPQSFIEACKILADHYATTIGAVIDTLVSDSILANIGQIAPPLPGQPSLALSAKKKDWRPSLAMQGDEADRMSSWRSLIRQEFAKKKSLAIYAPAIEDCDSLFKSLEKGIEGYIFRLDGSQTPKKVAAQWKAISETEHPVVIIATGSFSLLPRGDIETVGIERENGRGWISQRSPCLDLRHALETIGRMRAQTVILADIMLRTETLFRVEHGEIEHGSPFKWRSVSLAKDSLLDMKKKATFNPGSKEEKAEFRVFSPELESLIRVNNQESTHLFIITVRRGHSPMTVCADCQTIVICKQCSAPVVLHTSQGSGKNYFMCHHCGERRSADENCILCGGWRLVPLGIGIDKVQEEIKTKFPGIDVFRIDSESTKSEKQIKEAMRKFREKPGSILLGTELALNYLNEKVDHAAITSLDSLFTLPDFRIQEKIMYLIVRLRSLATRSILTQTRRPEEKVFEYGLKGNLSDFYKATLDERRQYGYPPYSVLVKITIEGKKDEIAKSMADLERLFEPKVIDIFPAFTSTVKGKSVIHGLIKIPRSDWPDSELIKKLRMLSPEFSVKINPESLL